TGAPVGRLGDAFGQLVQRPRPVVHARAPNQVADDRARPHAEAARTVVAETAGVAVDVDERVLEDLERVHPAAMTDQSRDPGEQPGAGVVVERLERALATLVAEQR